MENDEILTDKIVSWLKGQGYPLEMRVASAFQFAGFRVTLGSYYTDIDSGNRREIDVTAQHFSGVSDRMEILGTLRIECKLGSDKPWIVFMADAQDDWYPPFQILSSQVLYHFLCHAFEDQTFANAANSLPLLRSRLMGHGITQAFTTGTDIPYQACTTAVKASIDSVVALDRMRNRIAQRKGSLRTCSFALPIVVTAGRLFECFLDSIGEPQVSEVEVSVVRWRGTSVDGVVAASDTPVYIVTERNLPIFVRNARETVEGLINVARLKIDLLDKIGREI